jgi:hypothetical protein
MFLSLPAMPSVHRSPCQWDGIAPRPRQQGFGGTIDLSPAQLRVEPGRRGRHAVVGRWTAEMFLIFQPGAPGCLPRR